jgi:hypothetical protein
VPEHVTGDADALAAEYVLGTLDFDERSAAESLRAQDAEFAAKVKVWERRLGELHLMVEPVDPDPDIWQSIKAKLPALPRPQPAIPVPELKPEPEPDRVPERQAQLTPSEPTPIAPQLAEAGSGESEHSQIEPGQTGAAGPEAQSEPAVAPASDVPITTDAPPAAPDAPQAPASWQAAPSEAPAALPSTESFDISAAAASAIADALAAPESPSSPVVGPSMTRAEPEHKFRIARRHLAIWRTAAVVMGLVVVGLATLVCLWRYWPERVPTELRPLQLMRLVGIAVDTSVPRRKPAPPESRFDE